MAPICSNCGGTDFLWASELKTGGRLGGGPLSLRAAGELTLGTRICRTCGHADLFLKDVKILHNPSAWRPHEFVPIVSHAPAPPPRAFFPAPMIPATADPVPSAPSAWASPSPSAGLAGPAAALTAAPAATPASSPAMVDTSRPADPATPLVRAAPVVSDPVVHLESSGGGPTVVLLSDSRPPARVDPPTAAPTGPAGPSLEREIETIVAKAEARPAPVAPTVERKVVAPRARPGARKRTARSK